MGDECSILMYPGDGAINSVEGMLEITVLSNVAENGVSIGTPSNAECVWHTDMTGAEETLIACLLESIRVT